MEPLTKANRVPVGAISPMKSISVTLLAFGIPAFLTGCRAGDGHSTLAETAREEQAAHELSDHTPCATFWTNAYAMYVTLDKLGKRVQFRGSEVDPTTGTTYFWDKAFSVGYTPTAAAFRHGNELYVAGSAVDGSTIVERWIVPPVLGMYRASLPIAPGAAIGTSIRTASVDVAIEGGTFIEPAGRVAPSATRSVIYSGTGVGPIDGLEVDPDARFLLATEMSSEWRLVQIRLGTVPSVHVLSTQSQAAGLAGATGARPIDNSLVGRMYLLATQDGGTIWIEDPTNDGILDSVHELDCRAFDTAFPRYSWSRIYP